MTFIGHILKFSLAALGLALILAALAMAAGALRPREELAFVSWDGLELMDVSTGITAHPVRAPANYGRPSWSPDGNRLAFESNLGGNRTEIFVINADGRGLRVVSDKETDCHAPVWSPDGRQIAYTAAVSFADPNNDIYAVDLDSGATRNLTQNPANDYSPRWSPDGRYIVFLSNREHLSGPRVSQEIYVMDTREPPPGNIDRLTNGQGGATIYDLAWSPDSETLAFAQASYLNAVSFIRLIDSRPGQAASEVVYTAGAQASWSPDGQWLAYAWDRGVYVTRADGTGQSELVTRVGNLFPAWSPDGMRIAFASQQKGQIGLFVVNADGSGLRRLTDIGVSFPDWRP
jgi:Tol biopolymer transport system component